MNPKLRMAWSMFVIVPWVQGQTVVYVDDSATGANTGEAWSHAFVDLQSALDRAGEITGPVEIRIAEGVYLPSAPEPYGDPEDARSVTFVMRNNVSLIGGFAGVGSVNPDERDIAAHKTVLSGDLNGDDGPNWSNRSDNAFHVLFADQVDQSSVLDGLTIYGGSAAPESSFFMRYGGGIWGSLANFRARECTFTGNLAEGGGALNLSNSSAEFRQCHFQENKAKSGGAVYLWGDTAQFSECTFRQNIAEVDGGAVSGDGATIFQHCQFIENHAGGCGGAVDVDSGHPLLVNSLMVANSAEKGGALCNHSWLYDAQLVGCTLAQNRANVGSAVFDSSYSTSAARLSIRSSIIWGNMGTPAITNGTPRIEFSCVQGGWSSSGSSNNIAINPGFVNPTGPDGNYRLSAGSPCIDAGDSLSLTSDFGDVDGDGIVMEPIPVDLDHNPRVVDQMAIPDTGQGFGPIIDMGAYEFVADCNGNHVDDRTDIQSGAAPDCDTNGVPDQCQADCDANGVADACQIEQGLSEDCNLNGRMDLCDLAAGVATDCNHNNRLDECELTLGTSFDCNATGLLDECDLAAGTSLDCDANGVPDECEPDCNANGVTDACDIRDGTSQDCNANRVPDECDIRDRHSNDCNNDGIPNECQPSEPALHDGNGNGVPVSCEIPTLFVDASAPAGGNGSSWATAYDDLTTALNHAFWTAPLVAKVYVAGGIYRPASRVDQLDARSATFLLVPSLQLLGGFAGRGAADPDLRDPEAFASVLDGDIKQDDLPGFVNRSDNVYHVISAVSIGDSGMLDGFTIRGGQADKAWPIGGAGLYLYESTPKVVRCRFAENFSGLVVPPSPPSSGYTVGCGGAIFYWTEEYVEIPAEVSIEDSEFLGNQSLESGGAVCGEDVSFQFADCVFRGNKSDNGGAFGSGNSYSHPTAAFERCSFESNTAEYGGAIYAYSSNLRLDTCSLTGNEANAGGGIYGWATMDILDTTFDSNIADDEGGGLYLYEGSIQLTGCRFEHNEATYGGGAIMRAFPATIMDCDFENNSATIRGGGLHTLDSTIVIGSSHFNNNDAGDKGGGVISRGRSEIHHCRFEENSGAQGGGLFHDGDRLLLTDSTFESNYAELGGGVGIGSLIGNGPVTIDRCELLKNHADQGGGLSAITYSGNLELRNSLLAQNYAEGYAGGLAGGGENLHISGCTIAHNTAASLAGGMIAVQGTTIDDSILWGNRVDPYYGSDVTTDEAAQIEALHLAQLRYSTVQGWTGDFEGTDISGDDPLFVSPVLVDYRSTYDFRPRVDSPAINAGDPDYVTSIGDKDLDGHARMLCGRVDMGAYEFGIGDADCDGVVDLSDFAAMVECADGMDESPACRQVDFDNDGDFDLHDFASMQRVMGGP